MMKQPLFKETQECGETRHEAEISHGLQGLVQGPSKTRWLALSLGLCLSVAALVAGTVKAQAQSLPRPDHVVIVVEENKSFHQVIGNSEAPYINALAKQGMLFTQSYGVTHPSQPNYLALFSGSTHGYTSNECPLELSGDNLGTALIAKGLTFATYAQSLPAAGALGCRYGAYFRKHNPAANWRALQAAIFPFNDFPHTFEQLPTVALVVPDVQSDMHDGSVDEGDAWLKANIGPYAQWALAHNSLLIVTWDEDDSLGDNRVATMFIGPMVRRGSSAQRINHYGVLRTLEEMYGLPYVNESAQAKAITGVWQETRRTRR